MVSSLKNNLKLTIILISAIVSCLMSHAACFAQPVKYVRVAIFQDVSSLSLKASGTYEISDAKGKLLSSGKSLKTTVTAYKEGILLGGKNFSENKIFIKTREPDAVIINDRTFRGDVQLIRGANLKLSVINYIELEDYIKGISVREISHYWPEEALKTGVIVFRSFALYKIKESAGKDYDLTSDTYSQVYGGKAAERHRINKAVDETKGLILTYAGEILPAFFSATCAGHTEDASLLWKINNPALKGVVCDFCKESPHYKWHYVSTLNDIKNKLAGSGYKMKSIKDIIIAGRDVSSRVTSLKIISDDKEMNISAKEFRDIMGPNIIRSANFQLSIVERDVVFEGFGWGHGVGLCQWGSYFMAKQGYNYQQILEYYYTGSKISLIAD
jgi:stage II sporulation protein D